MFLLQRATGEYVAQSGHSSSYTHSLILARKFETKAEAEGHRCVDNEVIVDLDPIIDAIRSNR